MSAKRKAYEAGFGALFSGSLKRPKANQSESSSPPPSPTQLEAVDQTQSSSSKPKKVRLFSRTWRHKRSWLMHDEDEDSKMTRNALGMPKEGMGTSRNAKMRFGPPKWEDVVFTVGRDDIALEIEMKYFGP